MSDPNMPAFQLPTGWIPHDQRTLKQKMLHDALIVAMPTFQLKGSWRANEKALLWDFAKAANNGKHLACLYQQVGSCVGHGKCKAEWYLQCAEAIRLGKWEKVILPYEPYGYAQSRVCAGITGGEDGSTGSGAADAAKKYGVLRSDFQGLPPFQTHGNTITFSGEIDRAWGQRGAPDAYVQEGVHFLVRTTALLNSAADAAQALQNGFPCTIASDWGGSMKPPSKGNPAVLLNSRMTTWNHQMMVSGWWDHPSLGEIFHIDNSWGEDAFPSNPDDAPPGGFWVLKAEMEYIIRQGDSFAYSQFDGFPADQIPWIFG